MSCRKRCAKPTVAESIQAVVVGVVTLAIAATLVVVIWTAVAATWTAVAATWTAAAAMQAPLVLRKAAVMPIRLALKLAAAMLRIPPAIVLTVAHATT
jgi:hypothetical protein